MSQMFPKRVEGRMNPIIRDIPIEVFIKILGYVLASCPIVNYYSELQRLCSIHQDWSGLITETPAFWAIVSRSHQKEVVNRALALSHAYPLVIHMPAQTGRENKLLASSIEFCQLVSLHSKRWFALRITGSGGSGSRGLLCMPAPMLRFVSISGNIGAPIDALFGGEAPLLSDVRLPIMALAQSCLFRDIRCLEIGYAGDIASLMKNLESSPNIVELHLAQMDIIPYETSYTSSSSIVTLGHLARLHLSNLSLQMMEGVITHLRAPKLCQVEIGTSAWESNIAEECPSLRTFLQPWHSRGSIQDCTLVLGMSAVRCAVHRTGDRGQFKLLLWTHRIKETLEWIRDFLAPSELNFPLKVHITEDLHNVASIRTILKSFRIEALRLGQSTGPGTVAILGWLKWLDPLEDGSMPVPELAYLDILGGSAQNLESLLGCIRERGRILQRSMPPGLYSPMAPLQAVHVNQYSSFLNTQDILCLLNSGT